MVEGKPIQNVERLPSLVHETDHFNKHAVDFTKRYLSKSISHYKIKNEFRALIEKI